MYWERFVIVLEGSPPRTPAPLAPRTCCGQEAEDYIAKAQGYCNCYFNWQSDAMYLLRTLQGQTSGRCGSLGAVTVASTRTTIRHNVQHTLCQLHVAS